MSPDVNVVGPPPRERRFVLGVDLGQTIDPTAIAIVERVLPPPIGFYFDDEGREIEAPSADRPKYHATWLERLALGTSYVAVVAAVRSMLARPPLLGHTELIIDRTGVGRAVYDLFVEAGLDPIGITITSGDNEHREADRSGWRVANWHSCRGSKRCFTRASSRLRSRCLKLRRWPLNSRTSAPQSPKAEMRRSARAAAGTMIWCSRWRARRGGRRETRGIR